MEHEEQVARSEETASQWSGDTADFYRVLGEASPDGITISDPAGRIVFASPNAISLFGCASLDEALSTNVLDWVNPADRETTARNWAALLKAEPLTNPGEYRMVRKDGTQFVCGISAAVLRNADGTPRGILAIHRDITERKRAEEALIHSRDLMSYVIEHSRSAIAVHDRDLRYVYVSQRYLHDYKVKEQDVIGKHHYEVFPDLPQKWRDVHQRALAGEILSAEDDPYERKDGSVDWTCWECRPWYAADGSIGGIIVYTEVINERKLAEEQREHLQAQLAQSQKLESIGRLAGGVAHDFNNLLTVINGYSSLALRRTQPGDPLFHWLTEVLRAGEGAADLARQLLAYGRKQVLHPTVLSLNTTVREMEEMLQRLVGEDIKIVVRLDPAVAPVLADRHQMEQVIMNLAVNARDAMPDGGTLTLETGQRHLEGICIECDRQIHPGTYVELAVRDTGTGMDEHTLRHLFEPFFTTKSVGTGTGLGLSTVQGIVIQSGGHVRVKSELGRGSAFYIHLPVAEQPAEQARALAPVDSVGGAETVLLVEDQEAVRQIIAAALAEYGYRVVETGDTDQALRICAAQPVDLLVTDVVMPKMCGVEMARRARLIRPGLKTLFISGYSEEAHERKWESLAGAQFLQKPFAPQALAAKVREVLEGR